jgi:hypothetical protein
MRRHAETGIFLEFGRFSGSTATGRNLGCLMEEFRRRGSVGHRVAGTIRG